MVVSLAIVGVVGAFLATAVPLLAGQAEAFVANLPGYVAQMAEHSTTFRRIDARFQLQAAVGELVRSGSPSLTAGLLSAGEAVLTATVSTLTVLVLTVYLLVRPAPHPPPRLPAHARLAPPAGHPDRRRGLQPGRPVRAGQPAHLPDRRRSPP